MIDMLIAAIAGIAVALFLIGSDKEAFKANAARVAREDREEWYRFGRQIVRFCGKLSGKVR